MFTNYIFNRPISPHLTIHLPQMSSLFSIWHRISGVLLIIAILFLFIFLDFLFNFNLIFISSVLNFSYWSISFFNLIFYILFLYHSLNGVRHLFWDLVLFLKLHFLYYSSFFIILTLFLTIIKIITTF